jgi:hypothetical protein
MNTFVSCVCDIWLYANTFGPCVWNKWSWAHMRWILGFGLKNWVWQKWYQSHVNRRNASLFTRVFSLVLSLVFEKIFCSNLSSLLLIYKTWLLWLFTPAFFPLSRWQESWQQRSTFVHCRVGMLCLPSPIVVTTMLATSRGLYGHYSWRWDIASPHSSSELRGCFVGTHTFGAYVWWSMRGPRLIVFIASTRWSRLPHQGGRLREAWERHPKKLWVFCDMKWMNKWSIRSTATSWVELKKELKLRYCLQEITTALDASPTMWSWLMPWSEILMRPSKRSSC